MINDSNSADRIVEGLRDVIRGLPGGGRLPATRQIAARWGASPVTVQRAIRRLVAEGLIETRPGAGTFVRHAGPAARADYDWQTTALGPARSEGSATASTMLQAPEGAIALNGSYPCEALLPARAVRTALARAARSPAAVERPPAAGLPVLRSWFARELAQAVPPGGSPPAEADVVVVPGGQSALASVFRALAAPGDAVVMESPTYWGAIVAARQAGLMVVPVARDGDAVDPAVLGQALAASRARLFYAQPHLVNPSGETWTAEQGAALLEVARGHGAFIVEDDWGRDFATEDAPAPVAARDADGHVVYIRSLTKSVSPALRVAGVIARGPARARIAGDRLIDELYVSGVLQAAAVDVLSAPGRRAHLRAVRENLAGRRDALVAHLERELPAGTLPRLPRGGLNLWLRLPEGTSARSVADRCDRAGLLVSPGDEWFPAEPPGAFLRLNFSGPHADRFGEAARILARAIAG